MVSGSKFLLSSQGLQYEGKTIFLPGVSKIWLTKYLDAFFICALFWGFFVCLRPLQTVTTWNMLCLPFHSLSFYAGGRRAKPVEKYIHSGALGNTCEFFDHYLNFWIYLLLHPIYKLRGVSIILNQGGEVATRFSQGSHHTEIGQWEAMMGMSSSFHSNLETAPQYIWLLWS